MKGFEDLLQLDPVEVAEKTYISIDEFKAILEKRFDVFGKSKATGFIKILEREYDLDLSEWMREFNASKEERQAQESDNIFVVPPAENGTIFENRFYLLLIIGSILLFAIFFIFYPGSSTNQESESDTSSHIVEEAKLKIQDKNDTEETEELLADENTAIQEEAPVNKDIFSISAQTRLWVGIKYLDNNKKESKIINEEMELDPQRDQIITLGHGYFKLILNNQIIEPKDPSVHKITYKDGKLSIYKMPVAKKKSDDETSQETEEESSSEMQEPDNAKDSAEPQE